jgi:Spy/CpxP family protein refolding chaperone
MARVGVILSGLFLAALLSSPVVGQGKPPSANETQFLGGPLEVLTHGAVRKELKLTDEQIQRLEALRGVQPSSLPGVKLRNAAGVAKATKSAMTEILKPAQKTRLKQIVLQGLLQIGGLGAALSDPDVAADLELTESQKKKIAAAVDADHKRTHSGTGSGGESKKKKDALDPKKADDDPRRKALDAKLDKLLTADQKAKLIELQGAPFKQLQAIQDEDHRRKTGGGDDAKGRERQDK